MRGGILLGFIRGKGVFLQRQRGAKGRAEGASRLSAGLDPSMSFHHGTGNEVATWIFYVRDVYLRLTYAMRNLLTEFVRVVPRNFPRLKILGINASVANAILHPANCGVTRPDLRSWSLGASERQEREQNEK